MHFPIGQNLLRQLDGCSIFPFSVEFPNFPILCVAQALPLRRHQFFPQRDVLESQPNIGDSVIVYAMCLNCPVQDFGPPLRRRLPVFTRHLAFRQKFHPFDQDWRLIPYQIPRNL
jgi:hypothetical protein